MRETLYFSSALLLGCLLAVLISDILYKSVSLVFVWSMKS